MNLEQLRQKLLAAARANPPADNVPYAFEKRITAILSSLPVPDLWTLWARALWRAALPCLVVMLVFGAVSLLSPSGTGAGNGGTTDEFSQAFEQTMLAAVDESGGGW